MILIMVTQVLPSKDSLPSAFWKDSRTLAEELGLALIRERTAHSAAQKRIQELEDENRALKRQLAATAESFYKRQRALELKVERLTSQLERANSTLTWFRKEYFGRKSEQFAAPPVAADEEAVGAAAAGPTDINTEQPEITRKRGQQPGSTGHGRTDRSQLPSEDIWLDVPNCACNICGKPYRLVLGTTDSQQTEVTVRAYRRIYHRRKYTSQCTCKGRRIITAPPPPRLNPRTPIGNSLWVHMLKWRYLRGVPTNRVLQDLALQGASLSAGTVTGGLQLINKLLERLYLDVQDHCRGSNLWNGDETTWRVFEDSNGQRCTRRWWFWLVASSDAIVYLLDKSRSKQVPTNFFGGSSGVLMTDRLASYKNLNDSIENAWCWAHQRRDFLKVFEGVPQLKDWAAQWLNEIAELFSLNHKRIELWQAGLCTSQEWKQTQSALEQHIRKLAELRKQQLQCDDLHKTQSKILRSMQHHWPGLTLFLADPRIPLTNNRAERLLRPLVVSRKNSYGSGAEWSGQLAAKLFTIFQTWLINGLNPETLLLDYLNECSKMPGRPPPKTSSFLPWKMSRERKQLFLVPDNIKLPG